MLSHEEGFLNVLGNGSLVMPLGCSQSLTPLPSPALEVWQGCSWCTSLCGAARSVNPNFTPLVPFWSLFSTVAVFQSGYSSQIAALGQSPCSAVLHLFRSFLVFTKNLAFHLTVIIVALLSIHQNSVFKSWWTIAKLFSLYACI